MISCEKTRKKAKSKKNKNRFKLDFTLFVSKIRYTKYTIKKRREKIAGIYTGIIALVVRVMLSKKRLH